MQSLTPPEPTEAEWVTLKWVPSTAHPEDLAVFFQSVGTVTSIELQSNSCVFRDEGC